MKHLETAFKGRNNVGRYIGMILLIFVGASTVGTIPLMGVIIYKGISGGDISSLSSDNFMDLSRFGISNNLGLFLLLLSYLAMFFAFKFLIKPLHGRSMNETINGREHIRQNRIWAGMAVWAVISVMLMVISLKTSPDDFILRFNVAKFIPLLLLTLLILPFQTSFEEIFFRGYLSQGIAVWTKNRWCVLVIISLVFGLMHALNPEVKEFGFWMMMPQYVLMGALLGLISILDDGIELALGIHFANNAFGSLFVTHSASALQTDAVFQVQNIDPVSDLISLLVISIIVILAFQRIYKWDFRVLNRRIQPELPPVPQNVPYVQEP